MARRIGCCYAVCVLIFVFVIPSCKSDTIQDAEIEYTVAGISGAFITTLDSRVDSPHLRLRRQVTGNSSTPSSVTTQQPPATTQQPPAPSTTAAQPTAAPTTAAPATTPRPTDPPTQRPAATNTPSGQGPTTAPNFDIKQDDHSYYISTIIPEASSQYFVELESPNRQDTLSSGHRVAVTVNLPFSFRFYGHNITNVTVATGGFVYMSPFLHQWLTATQYIAPLMANFDTSVSSESNILYKEVGEEFIIEWHDVILKDQSNSGTFIFQAKLKRDGTITFVYKTLPLPVVNISSSNHPVKIGLSDAFYNDTYMPQYGLKRRTIIEYHRVSFLPAQVEEGTVIVLQPMPTCNIIGDCETCAKHENVKFDCKWCDKVQRCSDGMDWYRQDWEKQGCPAQGIDQANNCGNLITTAKLPTSTAKLPTSTAKLPTSTAKPPTSTAKPPEPSKTVKPMTTHKATKPTTTTAKPSPPTTRQPYPTLRPYPTTSVPTANNSGVAAITDGVCGGTNPKNCKSKSGTPVAVIVVVVLIVVLLFGGAGVWVFYAYTHPTSASGIWLMEHRPSAMKDKIANIKFWKSSTPAGTKYQVESEA